MSIRTTAMYPAAAPATANTKPAQVALSMGIEDEQLHKASTYYHLLVNQFAIYFSICGCILIIAISVVWSDISKLRDDISRSLRSECNNLNTALLIYYILIVLTTAFALSTWLTWIWKQSTKYCGTVLSVMFLMGVVSLGVFNVVGSVYVGKPDARHCRDSLLDDYGEVLYNMILAINIILWCILGLPAIALLAYGAKQQWHATAALFPEPISASKLKEKERELLINPKQFRF